MMYRKAKVPTCLAVLLALAGCGQGQTGDDSQRQTPANFPGTNWQIEDIDNLGIVDRSMITLQFMVEGGVAGSTGCNRYFGSANLEVGQLFFSQLGNTRRACVPALMYQEQRFLEALQGIASYRVDEREILLLFDVDGKQRLRAVRIETDPTAASGASMEPQDRASETQSRFDCDSAGTVEVRFIGQETLQLTVDGTTAILQRERSASGARYVGDNIEFFNQGDEARLNLDSVSQLCSRAD